MGLSTLFFGSFLAATVVPFSSELILAAILFQGQYAWWELILVAGVGNTLGGMTGYALGYLGKLEWLTRYFGFKEHKLAKWQNKLQRYGFWLAGITFTPFIGDFIGIALGLFRVRWWPVLLLMFVTKTARYALIVWLAF